MDEELGCGCGSGGAVRVSEDVHRSGLVVVVIAEASEKSEVVTGGAGVTVWSDVLRAVGAVCGSVDTTPAESAGRAEDGGGRDGLESGQGMSEGDDGMAEGGSLLDDGGAGGLREMAGDLRGSRDFNRESVAKRKARVAGEDGMASADGAMAENSGVEEGRGGGGVIRGTGHGENERKVCGEWLECEVRLRSKDARAGSAPSVEKMMFKWVDAKYSITKSERFLSAWPGLSNYSSCRFRELRCIIRMTRVRFCIFSCTYMFCAVQCSILYRGRVRNYCHR